jgi:hypothetical protein
MTLRVTDGVHLGTDVQLMAREPHLGSDQGRPHYTCGSFGPLLLVLVPDSLAFRWAGSRAETLRRCRSRVGVSREGDRLPRSGPARRTGMARSSRPARLPTQYITILMRALPNLTGRTR